MNGTARVLRDPCVARYNALEVRGIALLERSLIATHHSWVERRRSNGILAFEIQNAAYCNVFFRFLPRRRLETDKTT
jgi:hypothetical protein